jgi:hypothetical protein
VTRRVDGEPSLRGIALGSKTPKHSSSLPARIRVEEMCPWLVSGNQHDVMTATQLASELERRSPTANDDNGLVAAYEIAEKARIEHVPATRKTTRPGRYP